MGRKVCGVAGVATGTGATGGGFIGFYARSIEGSDTPSVPSSAAFEGEKNKVGLAQHAMGRGGMSWCLVSKPFRRWLAAVVSVTRGRSREQGPAEAVVGESDERHIGRQ